MPLAYKGATWPSVQRHGWSHANAETQHNRAVTAINSISQEGYIKTLTCEILLHPIEVNLARHQNTSNRSQVTCEQT